MKKKWIPVVAAIVFTLGVIPVSASEVTTGNTVTDVSPAGDTAVTGKVEDTDSGNVTYIISIPDKIDFGTLSQPDNNTEEHVKTVSASISAVQIDGLNTQTSRVAVLLKDSATEGSFKLTGQDSTNSGKELDYSIYSVAGSSETNVTDQKQYPNGYLMVLFSEKDQKLDMNLKLEQNQLYGQLLSEWVGNYKGTLNFYSTVGTLSSYN